MADSKFVQVAARNHEKRTNAEAFFSVCYSLPGTEKVGLYIYALPHSKTARVRGDTADRKETNHAALKHGFNIQGGYSSGS